MKRRDLMMFGATGLALAACSGLKLPDINVNLPPEIKAIVDDAQAIVSKVESITGSIAGVGGTITGLIDKAKVAISDLTSGKGDPKAIVSGLVSVLGSVAGFLPPPYGLIATAIETLIPVIGGFIGLKMAARRPTGMTPDTARRVLTS